MNVRSIAFVLGLGACSGKKEADQMTKFADEMCACKTAECAEKVFPAIEKFTKENEGKEVDKSAADRYNESLGKAKKCYEGLLNPAAPAAEPPKPQTEDKK